jgi:hypothetical protein
VTTRGSLALLASFVVLVAIGLPLDRATTAEQQIALSALPWTFLAIALSFQPFAIRVQVIGLVILATLLECFGSLIWGAYRYRLENVPLYVPAAHGLFYLCALRATSLPLLQRHARAVVLAVAVGAGLYMLYGLIARPLPDLLGFVTFAIFIRFIVRGRYPLLYAVSFVMTTALELYGTGLGIWTWSPILPGLMLPAGNPPTGIGAGYAAMDALTRRIVARIARSRAAPRGADTADAAAVPLASVQDSALAGD